MPERVNHNLKVVDLLQERRQWTNNQEQLHKLMFGLTTLLNTKKTEQKFSSVLFYFSNYLQLSHYVVLYLCDQLKDLEGIQKNRNTWEKNLHGRMPQQSTYLINAVQFSIGKLPRAYRHMKSLFNTDFDDDIWRLRPLECYGLNTFKDKLLQQDPYQRLLNECLYISEQHYSRKTKKQVFRKLNFLNHFIQEKLSNEAWQEFFDLNKNIIPTEIKNDNKIYQACVQLSLLLTQRLVNGFTLNRTRHRIQEALNTIKQFLRKEAPYEATTLNDLCKKLQRTRSRAVKRCIRKFLKKNQLSNDLTLNKGKSPYEQVVEETIKQDQLDSYQQAKQLKDDYEQSESWIMKYDLNSIAGIEKCFEDAAQRDQHIVNCLKRIKDMKHKEQDDSDDESELLSPQEIQRIQRWAEPFVGKKAERKSVDSSQPKALISIEELMALPRDSLDLMQLVNDVTLDSRNVYGPESVTYIYAALLKPFLVFLREQFVQHDFSEELRKAISRVFKCIYSCLESYDNARLILNKPENLELFGQRLLDLYEDYDWLLQQQPWKDDPTFQNLYDQLCGYISLILDKTPDSTGLNIKNLENLFVTYAGGFRQCVHHMYLFQESKAFNSFCKSTQQHIEHVSSAEKRDELFFAKPVVFLKCFDIAVSIINAVANQKLNFTQSLNALLSSIITELVKNPLWVYCDREFQYYLEILHGDLFHISIPLSLINRLDKKTYNNNQLKQYVHKLFNHLVFGDRPLVFDVHLNDEENSLILEQMNRWKHGRDFRLGQLPIITQYLESLLPQKKGYFNKSVVDQFEFFALTVTFDEIFFSPDSLAKHLPKNDFQTLNILFLVQWFIAMCDHALSQYPANKLLMFGFLTSLLSRLRKHQFPLIVCHYCEQSLDYFKQSRSNEDSSFINCLMYEYPDFFEFYYQLIRYRKIQPTVEIYRDTLIRTIISGSTDENAILLKQLAQDYSTMFNINVFSCDRHNESIEQRLIGVNRSIDAIPSNVFNPDLLLDTTGKQAELRAFIWVLLQLEECINNRVRFLSYLLHRVIPELCMNIKENRLKIFFLQRYMSKHTSIAGSLLEYQQKNDISRLFVFMFEELKKYNIEPIRPWDNDSGFTFDNCLMFYKSHKENKTDFFNALRSASHPGTVSHHVPEMMQIKLVTTYWIYQAERCLYTIKSEVELKRVYENFKQFLNAAIHFFKHPNNSCYRIFNLGMLPVSKTFLELLRRSLYQAELDLGIATRFFNRDQYIQPSLGSRFRRGLFSPPTQQQDRGNIIEPVESNTPS